MYAMRLAVVLQNVAVSVPTLNQFIKLREVSLENTAEPCLGDTDIIAHITYPLSSHGVSWPLATICTTQLYSKSA